MAIDSSKLDRWFGPQKLNGEQQKKADVIVAAARTFADSIVNNTPISADQSHAVRCVRDAMNAALESMRCGGA